MAEADQLDGNMNLIVLLKRLWEHIARRRKKQLGALYILMLIASFAEVVSIGLVVPFLGVLASPESVFEHELSVPLIELLGIGSAEELTFPLTAGFIFMALVSGAIRIILLWGQTRIAHAVGADLSYEIYRRTLYQPYSVHMSRNSSEVIAGISSKADQTVSAVILPILLISSSFLFLLTILVALVAIEPLVALSVIAGFGAIYVLVMWGTKKRLLLNSYQISKQQNQVIKSLQEGLGGVRDILIDGTQSMYCAVFRRADLRLRKARANNRVLAQSPRYGVEAFGMVLIACVAYVLAREPGGIIGVIPILGALAVGAQRMLPIVQQAYSSWAQIRGAQNILQDSIVLIEQTLPLYLEYDDSSRLKFERSIEVERLGFQYADQLPSVLREIDLVIRKGDRVGFIGSTGSGKSTFLDIIMGLLQPTDGVIRVDGVVLGERNIRGWQNHIAHVPQTIYLSDATIAENIAFGVSPDEIDFDRVRSSAQQAQISGAIEGWALRYDTVVGERGVRLSGGQRQRIGIARALYKQADVIVFDEATSALDSQTEKAVMEAIGGISEEITVLVIAHRVTTLEFCDYIIELEHGLIKQSGLYQDVVAG